MKINNKDVPTFIKNGAPNFNAVLIYGPDSGLVRERTMELAQKVASDLNDPFNVSYLSQKNILDELTTLTDNLNALSITGDRRLVIVSDASERLVNILEGVMANANPSTLLILRAGDLKTRNKLRILAEKSDAMASVACYADDPKDIRKLIDAIFEERNITCNYEVRNCIENSLGNDRAISRSEIEKLAIFIGDGGNVSLEDVASIIGDNTVITLTDLALRTAGGDALGLDRALSRCLNEEIKPTTILRSVANHMMRLQLTLEKMQFGENPDLAISKLRPPVFFKARAQFRSQLLFWTKTGTLRALSLLLTAERKCKEKNNPDATVCGRTLHQVAALARNLN